jgi:hypothetical protein
MNNTDKCGVISVVIKISQKTRCMEKKNETKTRKNRTNRKILAISKRPTLEMGNA